AKGMAKNADGPLVRPGEIVIGCKTVRDQSGLTRSAAALRVAAIFGKQHAKPLRRERPTPRQLIGSNLGAAMKDENRRPLPARRMVERPQPLPIRCSDDDGRKSISHR